MAATELLKPGRPFMAIGNRVHSHPTSARDGAALHDRQMALGKVHLNTYLIADMIRNPSPAPRLHPSNVRLRQTRHTRGSAAQNSPAL